MKGGVTKIYILQPDGWECIANASDVKFSVAPVEKPINEADFEVIESTLLTDQETCSGHECFFKRTGVRCIICKNPIRWEQ